MPKKVLVKKKVLVIIAKPIISIPTPVSSAC